MEQLQDEVVACRLSILKEYFLKGIFPVKDLLLAINCVDVDCESLERCHCGSISENDTLTSHFQIPQIITSCGSKAIEYIGSIDRQNKFTIVSSLQELNNLKYRKRAQKKPYVWIDYAPNSNGMLDCFIFNAPFLKEVSVVAVFKDPRQLNKFRCCQNDDELLGSDTNISAIDQDIVQQMTQKYVNYYRQLAAPLKPNTQEHTAG